MSFTPMASPYSFIQINFIYILVIFVIYIYSSIGVEQKNRQN